jgi:hypothetical protein
MFGELNKIFDKTFVVGYAIPASAFMATTILILTAFNNLPKWMTIDSTAPLKDTTFVALQALVLAIVLMSLNSMLFRLMEGYWNSWLRRRLNFIQRWRWKRINKEIERLRQESDHCDKTGSSFGDLEKYVKLSHRRAQEFPTTEGQVLPTSFGNTVRAFEDYPRVMYNFESITGWSRLNTVIPKDYREIMDDARAQMNMWINLWFLSLGVLLEYVILGLSTGRFVFPWIPIVILGAMLLITWQARVAAAQWGDWVKAAFDVYLPELSKKMGYVRPASRAEELKFWTDLGRAITFRNPDALNALDEYRAKPTSSTQTVQTVPPKATAVCGDQGSSPSESANTG